MYEIMVKAACYAICGVVGGVAILIMKHLLDQKKK